MEPVPRLLIFKCMHTNCGARFSRKWRLAEHETTHTGDRPLQCMAPGCGKRFSRRAHLKRHGNQHNAAKRFKCCFVTCTKSFIFPDKLKKHIRYAHGKKDAYFKCSFKGCTETFKKRRALKLHLNSHGVSSSFKCGQDGCLARFDSYIARKAHEKKHKGYTCPKPDCKLTFDTWGKMVKHKAQHKGEFLCVICQKVFKNQYLLRRHEYAHFLGKPKMLCIEPDCQACFTTMFQLCHHYRKDHLKLLYHHCFYPGCNRAFAMAESLMRHLLHHNMAVLMQTSSKRHRLQRLHKSWQSRQSTRDPRIIKEVTNLRVLFNHMRISSRPKLEADLSILFDKRKLKPSLLTEVNLRKLFRLKPACELPQVATAALRPR